MPAETTRSIVRVNAAVGGRLLARFTGQSAITEGSVVQLGNGDRYVVDSVFNPHGVSYSIVYVRPYRP